MAPWLHALVAGPYLYDRVKFKKRVTSMSTFRFAVRRDALVRALKSRFVQAVVKDQNMIHSPGRDGLLTFPCPEESGEYEIAL